MRGESAGGSFWMRQQIEGEEVVSSVVRASCDTETLWVPEQVSRSRLELWVHAEDSRERGGERSRSSYANSIHG